MNSIIIIAPTHICKVCAGGGAKSKSRGITSAYGEKLFFKERHCCIAKVACVGKDVTRCNECIGVIHESGYSGDGHVAPCKFGCAVNSTDSEAFKTYGQCGQYGLDGRYGDGIFGDFLKIIREIFGGYVGFLYFCNAMEVSTTCPMGLGPGLTSIPSFFLCRYSFY